MNENHDPGNDPADRILAPIEFNFTVGQYPPESFGKSEASVTVLPPVEIDFTDEV
jgi:hypothetical protein